MKKRGVFWVSILLCICLILSDLTGPGTVVAVRADGPIIVETEEEYAYEIGINPENAGEAYIFGIGEEEDFILNEDDKLIGGRTYYAAVEVSDNYRFEKWTDQNGNFLSDNQQYTFSASGELTLIANCVRLYEVTLSSNDDSKGTVSDSFSAASGDEVGIEAFPVEGFRFDHWEAVSGEATFSSSGSRTSEIRIQANDVEVKAFFGDKWTYPTVSIDNWTFGDEPNVPVINFETGDEEVLEYGYFTEYNLTSGSGVPTSPENSGAEEEYFPPQLPGEYFVKVFLPETDDYIDDQRVIPFSVLRKPLADSMLSLDNNSYLVSAGTVFSPVLTVMDGETSLSGGTDYVIDTDNSVTSASAPGTYSIRANGMGNYSGSGEVTWEIRDKAVAQTSISAEDVTYGTPVNPVVSTNSDASSYTITYSGSGETTYGPSSTAPTAVGAYSATVSYEETANYKATSATTSFIIDKAARSLSVSIENWEYGGSPQTPAVTDSGSAVTDYSVTYYTDSDCTEATNNENSGALAVGGVPVNVGEYYAIVSVGESDTRKAASEDCGFTITPRSLSDEMADLDLDTFEYTAGSTFAPVVTVMDGDTELVEGIDYIIEETSDIAAEEPGEYTITVLGIGNYTGSVELDWEIELTDTTAPVISGVSNNGEYHAAVSVRVSDANLSAVSVQKGLASAESVEIIDHIATVNITEIGEYTISALDTAGHAVDVSFKITQMQITIVAEEGTELVYGEDDFDVAELFVINGFDSESDFVEPEYSITRDETTTGECSISGGKLITEKAGTIHVQAVIEGSKYSSSGEATATVLINKAAGEPCTVAANDRTYDATEKALVNISGETNGGEMYYAIGQEETCPPMDDAETFAENWGTAVPCAEEAGTYYVWYCFKGDDNHNNVAPECIKVTVSKRKVTVTAQDQSFTYGDSMSRSVYRATITNTVDGHVLSGITLSGDASRAGSSNIVPSDAKITDSRNHDVTKNYEISYVNGTLIVTYNSSDWTSEPAAVPGLVYNGDSQALVTPGTTTSGVPKYALGADKNVTPAADQFSTNVPVAKKAGSYVVYYKVIGDGNHFDSNIGSTTVVIAQKNVEVAVADQKIKYGEAADLSIGTASLSGAITGHTLVNVKLATNQQSSASGETTFIPSGEWSITPTEAAISSGSGDVTANYMIAYKAGKLTVEKADTKIKEAPEVIKRTEYVIGTETEIITAGKAEGGQFLYALYRYVDKGDVNAADDSDSTASENENTDADDGETDDSDGDDNAGEDEKTDDNVDDDGETDDNTDDDGETDDNDDNDGEPDNDKGEEADEYDNPDSTKMLIMVSDYSDSIPTVNEVGKYKVFYYVKGDENHKDSKVFKEDVIVMLNDPMLSRPTIFENTTELHLVKGQKFTLTEAGWTVKKNKYLTISKKNVVSAKKVPPKPIVISKDLGNGETREIKVYISAPKLTSKKVKLTAGATQKLDLYTGDDVLAVGWVTSAPDIATVTQDGVITAVSKGKAKITAYVNGRSYKCSVTVTESTPASERTLHLNLKASKKITLKGIKTSKVSWKIDDTDIVTEKKGKFIAGGIAGSTTATGTAPDGKKYTVYVTVNDITIKTGKIEASKKNKYKIELKVGESHQIEFNGYDGDIVFISNKGGVAYCDMDGVIHALSAGKIKLTKNINGKKITITVKVTE